MKGFFNTLRRIFYCDGVNTPIGFAKHVIWQRRKLSNQFGVVLNISKSEILSYSPIGVEALINCMGIYDYNNMSFIKMVLNSASKKGNAFIDVGSNIGSYTLIASESKNTKVISIEPHPESFRKLMVNIELNKRKNVIPLNCAATAKQCTVKITEEIDSTKNRIINSDLLLKGKLVEGKTLDSICKTLNILPTVVKIDVEGFEMQVLQGFKSESREVNFMVVEGGNNSNIIKFMRGNGFCGPYYVHFKKRNILIYPHPVNEDPIFFDRKYIDKLKNFNFRFLE